MKSAVGSANILGSSTPLLRRSLSDCFPTAGIILATSSLQSSRPFRSEPSSESSGRERSKNITLTTSRVPVSEHVGVPIAHVLPAPGSRGARAADAPHPPVDDVVNPLHLWTPPSFERSLSEAKDSSAVISYPPRLTTKNIENMRTPESPHSSPSPDSGRDERG